MRTSDRPAREIESRWPMLIRWLWRRAVLLLVIYLGLIGVMMFLENRLIFPARTYPAGDWTAFQSHRLEIEFHSQDGERLHGWYFEHTQPRGYLLYCHGNAEHVADIGSQLYDLHRRYQLTVLGFDYRGYGKSSGKPHERGIVADGHAAFDWLTRRAQIPADQVILMGRSLGGGVAVQLAASRGARALILHSTFTSLPEVASRKFPWLPVRWLMRNRFDSRRHIRSFSGPLFQSHGTDDQLVDVEIGQALFEAAPCQPKRFVRIEGMGHNDPPPVELDLAMDQFFDQLLGPPHP